MQFPLQSMKAAWTLVVLGVLMAAQPLPAAESQPRRSHAKAERPGSPPVPPSERELFEIVLRMDEMPLGPIAARSGQCAQMELDFVPKTVGQYVATLLADFASAPEHCGAEATWRWQQEADQPGVWWCSVVFGCQEDENAWGYGLVFELTPTRHVVIEKSIECAGTP